MKRLSMNNATLAHARRNLVRVGLIAYQKPLYQVLALDGNVALVAKTVTGKPSCRGGMQSLKEILKTITENKP